MDLIKNSLVTLRNLCEVSETVNLQLTTEIRLLALFELLKRPQVMTDAAQLLLVISEANPGFASLLNTSPSLVEYILALLPQQPDPSIEPLASVAAAGNPNNPLSLSLSRSLIS